MYCLSDATFLSAAAFLSSDLTPFPPSLLPYTQLAPNELDSLQESLRLLNSEVSYSGSSGGCSSYGGSPTSVRPSLIQRSVSSQSLRKSGVGRGLRFQVSGLFDSEGPVRRVYSAGDLQGKAESSMIIEGMSKACRYSPQEKRERIERYKSKRNHRNFTKKIKYECRKTLADSRRRIRGRFARNEEMDQDKIIMNSPIQYSWTDQEDDDSWISFLHHSSSPNF